MSKDKGIFEPQEGFTAPPKSPFAVDDGEDSPFASPAPESKSPFSEVGDEKPTRLKPDEGSQPFASGGDKSPFGYEPPAASEPAPASASPFSEASKEEEKPAEPKAESSSPFADATESKPASSPFGMSPTPEPKPAEPAPTPAATPEPAPAAAAPMSAGDSDSSSIKQLELRAIFGVDRELTASEILQRAGSLPGIRHLARVAASEAGAVDAIKRLIGGLGFGGGQVKLYCGSAPIEFVREGSVLLAVQTDGGFAPGVRETLMIVARELGKM